MLVYIIKRMLMMIPTLLGVAVLIFLLLRVVPGDVVEARYMGQGSQFTSLDVHQILGLELVALPQVARFDHVARYHAQQKKNEHRDPE